MNNLVKAWPLFLMTLCFARLGYAQDIEKKAQLSFSAGRQQEDFNWSIAGNSNGTSPNVLSELKWKNVTGQNYSALLLWNAWGKISFIADYSYVNVRSGAVNDMDYNGDNRTGPVYTGNFSDNKGHTGSWSVGAGYTLFNNLLFSLIPYAGYGVNDQYLYLADLTGQTPGLNSSYQANWKGPFVRVISSLKIYRRLKFTADVTYNQANYNSQGDWDLIDEFQHPVSYRQVAKGYGINANARLACNITHNIAVSIGYGYFNWQTGNGDDTLYLSSGGVDKTRLNGVSRNGYRLVGGVGLSL
jgi:hypothetical protein